MIVVTGATGRVGSELTRHLLAAGITPRVLVRDPYKARAMLGDQPEIVQADYMKPETLDAAFQGSDRIYLVSPANPDQVEMEINVVDAAKRAGASHIVKQSIMGATPWSTIGFFRSHFMIERYIEDEGLRFTFLRPNHFMQNLLADSRMIGVQNRFYAPLGDGEISMVDIRDIAAMAVVALMDETLENKTYEISGPEAISMQQAAQSLSDALGREIHYVDISEQEARDGMHDANMPDWQISDCLTYDWFLRSDYGSTVTQSVAKVLGRPPKSFDDFARDYADQFGGRAEQAA